MLYNKIKGRQIAQYLLEIKAVILRPEDPFKWASGWLSPIYCDNRLILSNPTVRSHIKSAWASALKELFPAANAVAGVATAGIAHAALIADELRIPMAYIRTKPKDHGTQKLLEGKLLPEHKTVVIEDLVSTGKSSLHAAQGLMGEGVPVVGLMSVFSYGFPEADEAFKDAKIPFYSLCDYDTLIELAIAKGYVKQGDLEALKAWRVNPAEWRK
jgi:orotate phosphoribosyltransferase